MKRTILLMILGLSAGLTHAETDPATAARAAAGQLEAASVSLEDAGSARDRVAALTDTVKAYEAGLSALREGLRRAAIREAQIGRELRAQEDEITRLLGVLQSMGSGPPPVMLLHPSGPTGTARSGMILADIAPALEARTAGLRADLEEVAILRDLQQGAADKLQQGMTGVQTARTELSKAIADRTDLPQRFLEDPVKTALLIASTETLEGFASGLTDIQDPNIAPAVPSDITSRKGDLPLPVEARVLRKANEADAAGIRRPGIVLATRPNALVVAPTAATIRYVGPLLNYDNVMILEPQAGMMFVLAGMKTAYGGNGQVIPEGSPIGLMGGEEAEMGAILSQSGDGTGNTRPETLYIEVRRDNTPVDPAEWFRTE
ncbi:peptidoglycan DD-metalloendopeptidase family protein [Shimia thalassica]|uniref:murein hydrolase activator EnvC family protein n=1 Tax=Shimia thalassica TaxID=1715693 RepID=UPI001C0845E2|nr:peptidoglycan DD-metalloendopeptidase family protein [Shimia thalassica]MBU2943279.1 peptidoglycan DD-metalloendopeptidase family protein [Shimia thalassica]MDO6478920.1 peptidoglycan DD-metalloendopeptidase family protein [Shimia thalassica]MDO6484358.1 peptidoglycan DD-metalloendopeptidase family protein [Shimia thalassica]MDO6501348.1 peptidoglycan DD-metalloendopeptidase family protein [Shimia thalassica]MDO6522011.1 peptidoglycan DD-metalloendopeptidase family protein [Shimia thalassic